MKGFNMRVEEVLSEILGVPCGNVKFTSEGNSSEFFGCKEYSHGMVRCYLEFTTLAKPENLRVGSLIIASYRDNAYTAVLVQGEETARIARAVYEGLS